MTDASEVLSASPPDTEALDESFDSLVSFLRFLSISSVEGKISPQ
jgi:hypothetical protein